VREAPRPLPGKLPSIPESAKRLQRIVDRPQNRLADLSVGCLVELAGDGTPAWLTGSTVWLPAVFSEDPIRDGDFDIVFSSRESTETFVKRALTELNRRAPRGQEFTVATNALGGSRILHPDGRGVIDAWYVGEDQSIAELLVAYPRHTGDHICCAYLLGRNPTPANLLRIVRIPEGPLVQKPAGLFSKIRDASPAMSGAYPTARKADVSVIIGKTEAGPSFKPMRFASLKL
jgi:hypothetical protein